jgi:hypothetical protein
MMTMEIYDVPRALTDQESECFGGGTRGSISPPLNPPASQVGFTTISTQFVIPEPGADASRLAFLAAFFDLISPSRS